MKSNKRYVIPGELLGVEEENLPGSGVYQREGMLYSSKHGILRQRDYSAFVTRRGVRRFFPTKYSHLILRVVEPQRDRLRLTLIGWFLTKFQSDEIIELVAGDQTTLNRALLKITLALNGPAHAFARGDWICVPMLRSFRPHHTIMNLSEEDLDGVIRAQCPKCRTIMHPEHGSTLRCPACDHRRTARLSKFYEPFAHSFRRTR